MAEKSVNDLIHRIRVLASTHGYAIGSTGRWRETSTSSPYRGSGTRRPPMNWPRQSPESGEHGPTACQRVHGRVGYVVAWPAAASRVTSTSRSSLRGHREVRMTESSGHAAQ